LSPFDFPAQHGHQAALASTADDRDDFAAGRETERLDDISNFALLVHPTPRRRRHRCDRCHGERESVPCCGQ